MIFWIASYPKSGNTFLRALLASYFFTKDGNFNFDILNTIKIFPHINLFKNLGIDISNENEVIKNYIKVQEKINKLNKNSINFMKTHSTLEAINGSQFTDLKNTLAAIYVVRDPRNVLISYANHYQVSIEKAAEDLMSSRLLKGVKDKDKFENNVFTHLGLWSSNYNSWKLFKKVDRYHLVKYEELVLNPEKIFLDVLNFIDKFLKLNHQFDKRKFENTIETTSFNYLKNLENEKGFPEALQDKDGKKITFFKYGPKSNWQKILPKIIKEKVENAFQKEMKELGYL